ncbi:hypothetical protein DMA11_08005 [Marinilabiliaceae bacterium JC017]|nr:hypothetical protein DMA11_08005 [Marinilabiliaceae bacterium JC017]
MTRSITQPFYDFSEDEANAWLEIFMQLPDEMFMDVRLVPSKGIVDTIKRFARSYVSVEQLPNDGYVIN